MKRHRRRRCLLLSVRARLRDLLARYNVNDYPARVRIFAVKP